MECNKDEALRAKEIAEQKFSLKDIIGARKLAEKAERLYPGLEGVSHMLATFDVYRSAEKKINGETDWYAVLSVDISADIETIRKQYRKLALVLHPDKNKSVGADGAFNLLVEAWRVLSDKARRSTFDQKAKARGSQQKASESKRSAASTSNVQSKISKNLSSTRKGQNASTVRPPPHQPPLSGSFSCSQQKPSKFWTSCHKCKAQYEYLRIYLNQHLLCASCNEPFVAVEIAKSNCGPESSRFSSQQQKVSQSTSSKSGFGSSENTAACSDSFNQSDYPFRPFSSSDGLATASTLSGAGPAFANVVRQNENFRKQREEGQAFANRGQGDFWNSEAIFSRSSNSFDNVTKISEQLLKKRKFVDDSEKGDRPHSAVDNTKYGFGVSKRFQNFDNSYVLSHGSFSRINEPSGHEMRKMLLDKSRKLIVKKISEVNVQKSKTINISEVDVIKLDKNKQNALVREEKIEDGGLAFNDADPNLAPEEDVDLVSMNVPDGDFHDFDGDRVEGSFEANQIWAAYDDNDGMPRFYALIHHVLSLKPFKVEFSWLNSRSNNELAPLNWVASGFPKSCGEFRIGRHEKCNSVNVFSHKVRWEKGVKGVVKIYPKKADVWALYRNWSPDWDKNTADDIVRKYDMVEVLEDYTEEKGVLIVPLLKIAGFRAVFCRHTDAKEMKWIPREEMFRFSHQVPSCMVSSEAAPSAPKECVELDPAAVFSGTSDGGKKN